jgi:thiamine transporter
MNKSIRLTESAIMIAVAFVLSMMAIARMPFGGSITAFSMLPVALIAFRYKTAWGLFAGFTFAVLQLTMGLTNLQWATSATAVIAIILLDYIVAYVVVGISGIFRGKIKDNGTAFAFGSLFACVLRYISHVVVGYFVWAPMLDPAPDNLIIYSIIYNAAYMVPETLLMVVGAYFVGKAFTLTEPEIKRIPLGKGAFVNFYSVIPVSIGMVIVFVRIFGMMQSREGFDVTLLGSADIYAWITIAVIFTVGLLASIILRVTLDPRGGTSDSHGENLEPNPISEPQELLEPAQENQAPSPQK